MHKFPATKFCTMVPNIFSNITADFPPLPTKICFTAHAPHRRHRNIKFHMSLQNFGSSVSHVTAEFWALSFTCHYRILGPQFHMSLQNFGSSVSHVTTEFWVLSFACHCRILGPQFRMSLQNFGSSVWNLFHVTFLAPRILG